MNFLEEIIIELTKKKELSKKILNQTKRSVLSGSPNDPPSNVDLISVYRKLVKQKKIEPSPKLERVLNTRPVRSLSGIVNVSVLTKPYPCPGRCIFCPFEENMPKSYLSGEPAADRAQNLDFDPYLQVKARIKALQDQGHPTDKIELRIVGGTWSAYPKEYREEFVRECFRAANDSEGTLQEEQKKNERANFRIVGMSVETRADHVNKEEIKHLRKLGVTMVELGVQTLSQSVHDKNKTDTTIEEIAHSTKLLKESGFKVLYQVMPNLYGSDIETDMETYKKMFNDQRFKPDWLKIYPCVVLEQTPLYKIREKHKSYSRDQLIDLIIEMKKETPFWNRIARIYRDIPASKIKGGTTTSNIRELAQKKMSERCHCIRCREVRDRFDPNEEVKLFREDYEASDGKEIFLSFENKNRTKLFSYLRLRQNEDGTTIIRELQTLGPQIEISEQGRGAQHKGLGSSLIQEAEKIAKEWGSKKMSVISGVGVRGYYRDKHNYHLENTYMVTPLS